MSIKQKLDKLKARLTIFETKIAQYQSLLEGDEDNHTELDRLKKAIQQIETIKKHLHAKEQRIPQAVIPQAPSKKIKGDSPNSLPPKLIELIAEQIADEAVVAKVIQIIEPIYQNNIANETDAAKKKVASQAIVNVLKREKGNFSQTAFHAEFKKLYGESEQNGTKITTVNLSPAIKFPDNVFFEQELGENGKFVGKVTFDVNSENQPLFSATNTDIPDTTINGSIFKNKIDPIGRKLTATLLSGGVESKGINGYDWLTLKMETNGAKYSKNLLDSEDFALTIFEIKGIVQGTIPAEIVKQGLLTIPFYKDLASATNLHIDKWIKVAIVAEFSYNLTISKNDRKLLEKMRKLGNKFIEEVKALEPLKKDFEADTKKSAKAKNNLKKAKGTKDKKIIKQAEQQLNKASNQLKQSRRKLKSQENKLKKIASKIDDAASKLSKTAKPLGKLLKKQIAKRAFSIASKFIPGLNIITTAMDIYDVAVIFGPVIIAGAKSLYEELTKEEDPVEDNPVEDNKIYGGVEIEYIAGSAQINENNQTIAVNLIMIFGVQEEHRTVVFDIERKEAEVYYLLSQETISIMMEDGNIYRMLKGSKATYSNNNNDDLWKRY